MSGGARIHGIGVDVVDLARFAQTLERTPEVAARLFRPGERGLSTERLAARFAAKEAFVKALRGAAGLSWQDIEVVADDRGAPDLVLSGAAAARVAELGVTAVHVSLSHDTSVATAFVVAEVGE